MVKAKAIMTTGVVAVTKDTDIYQAIRTMVANDVNGLPVVTDDGTLVGVVTEKDVLSLLYNIENHPGTVEDFMTPEVVAFDQDDDVVDIAERLGANDFRRVPILADGKLVGIISRRDLIKYILEPIGQRRQFVRAITP
ncbi:MAG: CBS domain-containing protein [Sedimentisphaerales bacterium]|nr:CBS domain-containing protein [Sedimentisphaerales bacterium]